MTECKVPLVSVVMPSYNHARFIGSAVESVLGQTCSDLELIVVDNNSSDGTDAALAAVSDPRLKVIKFSNNGIIAASRNRALKEAKGEFVAFVDSDDVWLPEKLERQLEALRDAPGAVMAYCRFRTIVGAEVSSDIYPAEPLCVSGKIFREIYSRQFIACSGVVVHRKDLEAVGGYDESRDMFAIEDTDLWLRLSGRGDVVLSSMTPLFLYRVHSGASSGDISRRYLRAVRLLMRHGRRAGIILFLKSLAILSGSALKRKIQG